MNTIIKCIKNYKKGFNSHCDSINDNYENMKIFSSIYVLLFFSVFNNDYCLYFFYI